MRIMFWVSLVTFLLDQVSKYVVVHILNLRDILALDVFPPLLTFRMAWNYGINFGLLSQDSPLTRWVLITVALAITACVIWWIRKDPSYGRQNFAAGLLVGGALGNVIDRLVYGAVADFINTSCCGFHNPFAFNIADIAIFAGAFGMILFGPEKKPS